MGRSRLSSFPLGALIIARRKIGRGFAEAVANFSERKAQLRAIQIKLPDSNEGNDNDHGSESDADRALRTANVDLFMTFADTGPPGPLPRPQTFCFLVG